MDLRNIAPDIELGTDGIWFSRARSSVSYPDSGNETCYEIEDTSFWFHHRNRCVVEILRRLPPAGGFFFDIGGGNGCVSLAIRNAGWPVVLIEPGACGAANARRRGIEHVICATFQDACFLDGSVAAAGAFDVLEHIEDDREFLRSITRCLAPGGRLYLTVPAFRALWSREDECAGHQRRYTARGLGELIEQAGLQAEYVTYFFEFLPFPILLMRAIPCKLGITRSDSKLVSRSRTEHRAPGGRFGRVFQRLLDRELRLIRAGRTMPFGGSCLAVGRKISPAGV